MSTTMTATLPTLLQLKAQARALREGLAEDGAPISHGRALELVARQFGHRDWNTLHAAVDNQPAPPPWSVGMRVRGTYLGQPFQGEVIELRRLTSTDDAHGLTVKFDAPVDVVTSAHFSNFRRRVSVVVNAEGVTAARTSDGRPHMTLTR